MYADTRVSAQGDKSDMTYRHVASVLLGVALFLFYFQPFLPYSQRMRSGHSPNWWWYLIIELIGGFLLSLGVTRRRFSVPTCLLLTLFVANAILIVADWTIDATDHNLFPFEFLLIAVATLPAYVGAFIAAAVDRFRERAMQA
jgi:hypothetical protein